MSNKLSKALWTGCFLAVCGMRQGSRLAAVLDTDPLWSCGLPPGSQSLPIYPRENLPLFSHLQNLFTVDASDCHSDEVSGLGGGRLFMCVLRLPNWNRNSICVSI